MISIKTIEKDDNRRRQFRLSFVFATSEACGTFVCELFPITRINQDFLLAIRTKILN